MSLLRDKVAIVTGGGMGIGRAIATLFAEEGADVVVADVDREAGEDCIEKIRKAEGNAIYVTCDVSQPRQVKEMVEASLKSYGGIDILVNNAGISISGTVVDTEEDIWERVLGINLTGVYLCSKYAIPYIQKRGGGAVINIASVAGLAGLRDGAAYNASKGGVVLLTKNMALDFAAHGIRVNCICPGATVTPMYESGIARSGEPEEVRAKMTMLRPLGRLGDAHEIAEAALFLGSDRASYITGEILVVDGGVMAQFPGQIRPGT